MASYSSDSESKQDDSLYKNICLTLQKALNSEEVTSPKISNKLQISALVFFFKAYPFLPPLPFGWSYKKQRLVHREFGFQLIFFTVWVLLFECILGVVWPLYLIWIEFRKQDDNPLKMGVKKSLFVILYTTGTLSSIGYTLTTLIVRRYDLGFDYHYISKLTNHLKKIKTQAKESETKRIKIDVIGLMTHAQVQCYLPAAYILPGLFVFFNMDPFLELVRLLYPTVPDNGLTYDIISHGIRLFLIYAWMTSACRSLCGTQILAFIFFETFNDLATTLSKVKNTKVAIRYYWVYYAITSGFCYYARTALYIGIYIGMWLIVVANYATINILPSIKPLTWVYACFPLVSVTGFIVFSCVPIAVKFPGITSALISKWKYEEGINTRNFSRKIMEKELAAMQPVHTWVGSICVLDEEVASRVVMTLIDRTIDVMMTF